MLVGATGSGKSELALTIARANDAEIVGADSRQIYRGMRVGTAAPDDAAQRAVPHHCIEFLDPRERYSAAQYARDAIAAVREIRSRKRNVLIVGGTGFYLRVLKGEVELGARADDATRTRLAREAQCHPPEVLHEWLASRDPRRAAELHHGDRYRILRALEIVLAGCRPSEGAIPSLRSEGIAFRSIALNVPLRELDARIEARARAMFAGGLLDEAQRLGADAVAADAVGYPQALAYLRGHATSDEAQSALSRATRRYARRQLAWFRRERDIEWLSPPEALRAAEEAFVLTPRQDV